MEPSAKFPAPNFQNDFASIEPSSKRFRRSHVTGNCEKLVFKALTIVIRHWLISFSSDSQVLQHLPAEATNNATTASISPSRELVFPSMVNKALSWSEILQKVEDFSVSW
jgi:hypothetical protein